MVEQTVTSLPAPPETTPHTVSVSESPAHQCLDSIPAPRLDLDPPPIRRLPPYKRAKASWRPPLILQDRDIELLKAAAEFRLLSTPQFRLLFPESRDGVYRRLQGLFHHGYLDRLKGDPSSPMVYGLGTRGAEVLVERGILAEVKDWRKKNQELQDRYIAHQTMVADFRITLTLAGREHPEVRLLFFHREGHALRDQVTARQTGRDHIFPINPDGFFGLQFPELPEGKNRAFFFLEADRSTMTTERFLRKLLGYWEWYQDGGHTRKLGIRSFRVLTVTKSEERMRNLLRSAAQDSRLQAGLPLFWFASQKSLNPEVPGNMLAPVWEVPDKPGHPQSLLP